MSAEQFWKINTSADENQVAREKHVPVITVEGDTVAGSTVKVTVDVGGGKHPNESAHHIQWVELRANGLFIARAEFTAAITTPVVTFNVVVPEGKITLTAIERCNLHGLWESDPVEVG